MDSSCWDVDCQHCPVILSDVLWEEKPVVVKCCDPIDYRTELFGRRSECLLSVSTRIEVHDTVVKAWISCPDVELVV